jgi:hypothetical protein
MDAPSVWLAQGLSKGWRIGNFFEIIFHARRGIKILISFRRLGFFMLKGGGGGLTKTRPRSA